MTELRLTETILEALNTKQSIIEEVKQIVVNRYNEEVEKNKAEDKETADGSTKNQEE